MRIGIYGGSFNPPHIAHLIFGEMLYEELQLDKMIFVPSATPPHKKNTNLLDAQKRLRLLQLAISGNERFEVSDIEIQRGGTSYTIDTINALDKVNKNATLYLVVGTDNLVIFHQWKNYQEILDKCTPVAIHRPGIRTDDVQENILARTKFVELPLFDISSTGIRQRIRDGKSIRYLVPDSVYYEIGAKGFYKND